jgi:hypothetical protein
MEAAILNYLRNQERRKRRPADRGNSVLYQQPGKWEAEDVSTHLI